MYEHDHDLYNLADPDNYELSTFMADHPNLRFNGNNTSSTYGGGDISGFWNLKKVLIAVGVLLGCGLLSLIIFIIACIIFM